MRIKRRCGVKDIMKKGILDLLIYISKIYVLKRMCRGISRNDNKAGFSNTHH